MIGRSTVMAAKGRGCAVGAWLSVVKGRAPQCEPVVIGIGRGRGGGKRGRQGGSDGWEGAGAWSKEVGGCGLGHDQVAWRWQTEKGYRTALE